MARCSGTPNDSATSGAAPAPAPTAELSTLGSSSGRSTPSVAKEDVIVSDDNDTATRRCPIGVIALPAVVLSAMTARSALWCTPRVAVSASRSATFKTANPPTRKLESGAWTNTVKIISVVAHDRIASLNTVGSNEMSSVW